MAVRIARGPLRCKLVVFEFLKGDRQHEAYSGRRLANLGGPSRTDVGARLLAAKLIPTVIDALLFSRA
jgi:hypothetical protein